MSERRVPTHTVPSARSHRESSTALRNSPREKTSLHSEGVDRVYPEHANALCKAVLAPPDSPTMGDLWKMQDEKLEIENEKEPDVKKKKHKYLFLCCLLTFFSTSIHRFINRLKKILISLGLELECLSIDLII